MNNVTKQPNKDYSYLRHHGDIDAAQADARIDLSVNVVDNTPPQWLRDVIAEHIPHLHSYPSEQLYQRVKEGIAAHHGIDARCVLPLAGVAEGFSFLPQLFSTAGLRTAVIPHPGFTEPEWVLRRARIPVSTQTLQPPFELEAPRGQDADSAPGTRQLWVIGNPTNPTGQLHDLAPLAEQLADLDSTLVADEAFIDTLPPQLQTQHSLVHRAATTTNTIVFRSATKTYGLAGLRCGYAVAHPDLIEQLTHLRPHWPMGTLQLAALDAIYNPSSPTHAQAKQHREQIQRDVIAHKEHLIGALTPLGFDTIEGHAPYILTRTPWGPHTAENIRQQLAAQHISIRRCDTFPGLDASWWRLAVRNPATTDAFIDVLMQALNNAHTQP